MIEYILPALIVVVIVIGYYQIWAKPQRQIEKYAKQFQALGYRVKRYPYNPFKYSFLEVITLGLQNHSDALYFLRTQMLEDDILIGNAFARPSIVLFHPQLIKEFCNQQREWNYIKFDKITKYLKRASGKGLVLLEGQHWKKQRKAMNRVFNFDFLTNQIPSIKSYCLESFELIEESAKREGRTYKYSIKELALSFSSRVIFGGFLGGNLKEEKIKDQNPAELLQEIVCHCTDEYNDLVSMVLGLNFLKLGLRKKDRVFKEKMKLFNNWCRSYTKERINKERARIQRQKQNYIPNDIISSIQNFKMKDTQFEIEGLEDQLKTFFIGGMDTTSRFFMALVYYVYSDPKVLKTLKEEIKEKVTNQNFEYTEIKDMKYLEAIQKETIRLLGPGNSIFPRQVIKDHNFLGAEFRKGSIVECCSINSHYSPKYYKDPSEFRPERWLNGQCDNLHPFAFYGFHAGNRGCIGKQLALIESKVALILFAMRYEKVEVLCEEFVVEFGIVYEMRDYDIKVTKPHQPQKRKK